ncbi:MAG: hypothetical protein RMM51_09445 [Verrucomicrobiae bacterium]|nr:hypothetical protein [Verrucomicrobiae bacterium]
MTVWTGSSHDLPAYRLWFFPLVALAVPFLCWAGRGNRYHVRSVLVAWLIALILPVGTGFVLNPVDEAVRVWPVVFSSLFALLYLIGQRWWSEGPTVGQRPFQTVGALGVCGLAAMMSFGGAWEPVGFLQRDKPLGTIQESLLFATATGFPVAALAMWVRSWTRRAWDEVLVGGATLFAIVAWILAMQTTGTMGAVLLNVYLFVLGTGILAVGLQQRRLATVNAGMAILAVMILCRFFDMDLSLVVRGVAFIVVGTGFLAVNWFLWKWRRAEG